MHTVDWSSDFDTELEVQFDYDDNSIAHSLLPHMFPSNGDMRLVSSTSFIDTQIAGRLEVYTESLYCNSGYKVHAGSGEEYGGKWGTVCGQGFSMKEAHVACRQLGFQGAQKWNYSIHTEYEIYISEIPAASYNIIESINKN